MADDTIDYRQFRTPFFRVEVGVGGSTMQELPMQILKLVESIEIMETIQGCNHNQLTIRFIEGSREPYSKEQGIEASIYEGGSFSNHTGFITDLKAINNGGGNLPGFSFASTVEDIANTITQTAETVGDALSAVGLGGSESPSEIEVKGASEKINTDEPQFVFFSNNRIKVTWGYIEDPNNTRSFSGRIKLLRTNFPEAGHPITEIVAHGSTSEFDQLTTKKGILFKSTSLLGQFGSAFGQEDEDIPLTELLDQIGSTAGFEVIRSSSFDAQTLGAGKAKTWAAGVSLHQFLNKLAKEHHAVYTVIEDFSTGKPAIVFIRKEEFDRTTIIPKNLMFYRQPGSILKSVDIKADFSSIINTTSVGVDPDNKTVIRGVSTQGSEKQVLYENQKLVDTDPTKGSTATPAGKGVDRLANGGSVGHVGYHPSTSPDDLKFNAINNAACNYNHTVTLEFTTLGFPKIKPGSCPFQGIGQRYSGFYSIQQVSHVISNNSYICKGFATGSGTQGDGVTIATKGQELSSPSEAVRLYHEKTNTQTAGGGQSDNINFNVADALDF